MARYKKMIFLDRDGVINKNPVYRDYIKKPSEFHFVPGARRAIRMLNDAGFDIVVISNQAGVARGLFSRDNLKKINEKMMKGILASGGRIRRSYYCIHPPDADCECRKPKTGMIKKAIGKSKPDLKGSFFVGDTEKDITAGKRFGLKTIAVLSGYHNEKDMKGWGVKPDFIARDLLTAVKEVILKNSS